MEMSGEPIYGFWATVRFDRIHQQRPPELLLNGEDGLKNGSLPLNKTDTINTLWEDMFRAGLDSSGSPGVIPAPISGVVTGTVSGLGKKMSRMREYFHTAGCHRKSSVADSSNVFL